MTKEFLQDLISFAQQKGFVWGPEPEIYGGSAGFYTYAPLGKLLKNNVENAIRKVFSDEDFFEVECPIVMPKKVWEASGHLGGFSDPIVKDKKGNVFRADNLIEEKLGKESVVINGKTIIFDGASEEDLLAVIKKFNIKSPTGEDLIPEIKKHNLMMKTTVGLDGESYNRPETATTTYLPFIRYVDFFRSKFPFGVFQIGKAFRNEISPRQHVLRQREFTQAEGQLFLFKEQKNNFPKFEEVKNLKLPLRYYDKKKKEYVSFNFNKGAELSLDKAIKDKKLKNKAYAWTLALAHNLFINVGIPKEKIRLTQHEPEKMAFYAEDAWDIEINLKSFGWFEVCGVHDRADYDLTQHSKFSNQKLQARMDDTSEPEVPHVLEIAFGSDRPTFALLDIYYEKLADGVGKTTFKIPAKMAPIKIAVLPLMRKPELIAVARSIYDNLKVAYKTKYDETASIGKRYLRASEEGIPYCITIDYESLDDKCVTVRERDSEKQERVKISELKDYLFKVLN